MKFKVETRPKVPVLALTSMLDVIFLLLCFFVTASVYSQWESEISVRLPRAATADEPHRLPGEIIANITKDGTVRVNGVALTIEDLTARLARISAFYPDQAVIVRADRQTPYDALIKVLDACRAANVWNFSFATAPEGAGGGADE